MTVVWLLDVDGVINASRPRWSGAPVRATVHADKSPFSFRWDPQVTAFIRECVTAGRVEVRWSTTWVPWIDAVEHALGLPNLPVAFPLAPGDDHVVTRERKVQAALRVVEQEGHPLVWTDDEVVPVSGDLLSRIHAAGPDSLLIRPRESHGLTRDHLNQIDTFLRVHTRR